MCKRDEEQQQKSGFVGWSSVQEKQERKQEMRNRNRAREEEGGDVQMFLFVRDSFETGAMHTISSILQVPKLRNPGQDQ